MVVMLMVMVVMAVMMHGDGRLLVMVIVVLTFTQVKFYGNACPPHPSTVHFVCFKSISLTMMIAKVEDR